MKLVSLGIHVWSMVGLLMLVFISSVGDSYLVSSDFETKNEPPITYDYDRIDEVKKACSNVLSSASTLKPDDNRFRSIIKELTFSNGDWNQDENGAPLMPFDDKNLMKNSSDYRSPLHLGYFVVNDIDRTHQSKKLVSVNGVLQLGITPETLYPKKLSKRTLHFQIWPGHSLLLISLQGIYIESERSGGERVMCLLGDTMLPSRVPNSTDPWEWMKDPNYINNQPPLLQDDRILLVLHYPKEFSLTKRAIRGEMKSLNPKSNLKYFDTVHISSQLGNSANYEFKSEGIISKACTPYPYQDSLVNNSGIETYEGLDFCAVLKRLISNEEALTIVPNWRCNGTDNFCSKLGPFIMDKEIKATDGGFKDVKLLMQNVRCEHGDNRTTARVSTVFRVVHPQENSYTASQRSGLGNTMVSAEGIWKSSTGQLCMAGCPGIVDAKGDGCDSRICLYIPLSFSIKQRSIIVGRFSSIVDETKSSYFPLSFEKLVQPSELWDQLGTSDPYYSYSKIDSAGIILEKSQPFSFGTIIKKSLLKYPKLETTDSYLVSLSLLSEDLTLHVPGVLDPYPSDAQPSRTDIRMVISSLGPLFGRYWSSYNGSNNIEKESPYQSSPEYTEKQLLLNVSAQLTLTGKSYDNFSVLFLEGLYDPHVGKMYLIGCRDVRASWKVLHESMDLEAGLDCLIEVILSYPPTASRWLVNPSARVSISSQRNEDDPLHFRPIKLQTFPVLYRKQREDILSRRGIEGILRISTLSIAIACISSQLFYIRDNVDSVPYTSLVMLGVQGLGYSLPLITGAEALFKRVNSESYRRPSSYYDLESNQWFHVIDYAVKLLVMASFLLTLRLCQKVWKSRIRFLSRAPLEPHHIPSDKKVLLTTLTVHVVGYVTILIFHSLRTSQRPLKTERFVDSTGNSRTLRGWLTELDEYVGLIQDLFLLPQIIGNFLWEIDCKPLRKLYFIGITAVRLLPHVYDYVRAPVANPYFSQEYEFVNPRFDFYSKFGDVAIPMTAIVLAVVIYVQQRWNYERLSKSLTVGQRRLLPLGSKVYQRLPSKSFEAELVCGVNPTEEKEHDDDEE